MKRSRFAVTALALLMLCGPVSGGAAIGESTAAGPGTRGSAASTGGSAASPGGPTTGAGQLAGAGRTDGGSTAPVGCTPSAAGLRCVAPALNVTAPGVSAEVAENVIAELGLGDAFAGRDVLDPDGVLRFIDPDRFQALPALASVPGGAIPEPVTTSLGLGEEPEEVGVDLVDLPAIAAKLALGGTGVVSDSDALGIVGGALSRAGVLPAGAVATVSNTKVQLAHNPASPVPALPGLGAESELLLDTQVSYDLTVGGIPVRGPGFNISVTLDPEGAVSQLHYAARGVGVGPARPIASPAEGPRLCRAAMGLAPDAQVAAELVYFAPALGADVSALLPSFQCSAVNADGSIPLDTFVPAVRNGPVASFVASAVGARVQATGSARGGTPPYRFSWTSTATAADLQPPSGSTTSYTVATREPAASADETLILTVTDANGLTSVARQSFEVDLSGGAGAVPLAHGGREGLRVRPPRSASTLHHPVSGIEVAADGGTSSPDCKPYTTGWVDGNSAKGTPSQFHFLTDWAWSTDFKSDTLASPNTGQDHNYADDVDMMFYCGHGFPGGFNFENTNGPADKNVTVSEARWGDRDLEWLALLSCQVLRESAEGWTWTTLWGSAFNGLHALLGFHTNAAASGNLGADLAKHMHGYGYVSAKKIHESFVQAAKDGQPAGRIWATVYPVSTAYEWNRNDFFHGRGSVSADIAASNIYYFVRYSGTV